MFTVTKFDRFAQNMAEANDLSGRGVLFGLDASVYDWSDPFGRLFLQPLAMVAEFEANTKHQRTRESMALAKKNGKLKGKQPKLPEPARRSIRRAYRARRPSTRPTGSSPNRHRDPQLVAADRSGPPRGPAAGALALSAHTLATNLPRADVVAELLGHVRLDTTRRRTLPTHADLEDAVSPHRPIRHRWPGRTSTHVYLITQVSPTPQVRHRGVNPPRAAGVPLLDPGVRAPRPGSMPEAAVRWGRVWLVARREFRAGPWNGWWRALPAVWFAGVAVFWALRQDALLDAGIDRPGAPLFGSLMLFVLGLTLLVVPALTVRRRSADGRWEPGATPLETALGEFAAAWATGLVLLALTLPFVVLTFLSGGVGAARVVVTVLVCALLTGEVCALAGAMSLVRAYLVVAALVFGTVVASGLAVAMTQTAVPDSDGERVYHPERVWWVLAPNPVAVLADTTPSFPSRRVCPPDDPDDGFFEARPADAPQGCSSSDSADPLDEIGDSVRFFRRGDGAPAFAEGGPPVWPYGLAFSFTVSALAVRSTVRRREG